MTFPRPRRHLRRLITPLQRFLAAEASGGVVLLVGTAAALLWANVDPDRYQSIWHLPLRLGLGTFAIALDLQHWVNDALMALFFFVVGIEIKRELITGELRDRRAAALPAIAALGGVVLPAALFVAIVGTGRSAAAGWGIPMATDIAFVVGVMALLGSRVPPAAKVFLLSLAIVDDIVAILVIAVFYSGGIDLGWLGLAVAPTALVALAWRRGVTAWWLHVALAILTWVAVFNSGVHATIAGVLLGLLVPAHAVHGRPVLEQLERVLHPISAFVVVPLFALANAGLRLGSDVLGSAASSEIAWGVAVGLIVGKTVGIAGATFAASRLRLARLPTGSTSSTIWGLAALGGIGFTVSLFITGLAYDDPAAIDQAKIGIFVGSAVAGALGAIVLARSRRERTTKQS